MLIKEVMNSDGSVQTSFLTHWDHREDLFLQDVSAIQRLRAASRVQGRAIGLLTLCPEK